MIPSCSRQSFFLVFLTAAAAVSASAELVPRQSCDTLVCPSLPDLSWFWEIVGGATAWFGVDNGRKGPPLEEFILQPTPSETFQDPSENGDRRQDPKAENGIEIMITAPDRKGKEQCTAIISQDETDILLPGQTGGLFGSCDDQVGKVVWPLNCEDEEQNRNTERIMKVLREPEFPQTTRKEGIIQFCRSRPG